MSDVYTKNQLLEVEITDMNEDGEGIGKVSGYTLFVKDAVIGDKVKARLTKVKKSYSYARIEEIIEASKHRVNAPCPISRQCGGCQIQVLDYAEQLRFKEAKVKNDLVRLGGFDSDFIEGITESIIGMKNPFRYRNKAQYPVGFRTDADAGVSKKGRIVTGFYAGRTHVIIENDDCLIGCEENKEILDTVISYMNKEHVSAYDEKTGKGVVRHVLIRKGFTTGEIMVCLVVNINEKNVLQDCCGRFKKELGNLEVLVDALQKIKGMTSISLNINNKNTNVIMGDECITLWGEDTITDYIDDVKFKISPLSFFQVNPVQTEKLYKKALEYASLKGDEIVWDLYCGIGTISLFLARSAKKVYGVEIVKQAIDDAKENAEINGIKNAEFIAGAAEDIKIGDALNNIGDKAAIRDLEETEGDHSCAGKEIVLQERPDVIVVDPPRKGLDEALLDTILKVSPSKIVYVSCNPATLSRDLKYLAGAYELQKVCPVDLFPHTVHVETVCLLCPVDKAKGVSTKYDKL